jgi:chromatin segregation and condensation protein Rec8/ScpA/Scc1 (kleisin family)
MTSKRILTNRIQKLEELRQEKEVIDTQIKVLQAEIVDALDDLDQKTMTVTVANKAGVERMVKATKVQNHRSTIDEASLRSALPEKVWIMVSTRALDKRKLEAHMAAGDVDPIVVANASTETLSAPYIKLS